MIHFQKILAVIDPDEAEQKSLARSLEVATKTGASITAFLSIYDFSYEMTTLLSVDERENMRQAVVDERTDWLADLVEPLVEKADTSIDIKVVWHNRPYESIIYEVIDNSYDLIVKGTQQHSSLKSVIFTPTDWHLMRKAPVPVLLVKDHDWPENGDIVASINASTDDEEHASLNELVTIHGIKFAEMLSGKLNLVNAYPRSPVNIAIEIPEFDPVSYSQSIKTHHQQALAEHASKYAIIQSQCYVREGLPEVIIPQVAKEIDAELVVIGTVGRLGISAALIGNTAEHVIDALDCDVLTVKPLGFECPIKR
jgi:universal stress protein E